MASKKTNKKPTSSKSKKKKGKAPSWIKTKKYVYKLFGARYKLNGGWKSYALLDDTRKVLDKLIEKNQNTTQRNVRANFRELHRFKHGERFSKPLKQLSASSVIPKKPSLDCFNIIGDNKPYPNFIEPQHFWTIQDFLNWWNTVPQEIHFVSPMIVGKGQSWKGGTMIDYDLYFREWVRYLNQEKDKVEAEEESPSVYEIAWYYKIKGSNPEETVYWNNENQRYELEVISCDVDGVPVNFGWDTETGVLGDKIDFDYEEAKKRKKEEPAEPETPTTTTTPPSENIELQKFKIQQETESNLKIKQLEIESAERIKTLEIESKQRLKVKQLESLENMFNSGKISFIDYFDAQQKVING